MSSRVTLIHSQWPTLECPLSMDQYRDVVNAKIVIS